jgi:hypothetical protein
MRTRGRLYRIAAAALFASSAWFSAERLGAVPERYSLIDVMVGGTYLNIDLATYASDVQAQIKQLVRRSEAYRSKRPKPTSSGELEMVYEARIGYERRLIAAAMTPAADALAVAYVTDLAPCYEWEGYHDCPEREATFAASYQAAHPAGPFSQYLPLLEAQPLGLYGGGLRLRKGAGQGHASSEFLSTGAAQGTWFQINARSNCRAGTGRASHLL